MRKDNWGALVEAKRACELDQRHVEAHDLASDIARDLLQWDDALFHLEQAQFLDPNNPARSSKLERLRQDAKVYSRPVNEVVADARVGEGVWQDVCQSVFLRPDPIWYRAGWFHLIMAFAGLLFFMLAFKWVITTGPWFFLFGLLHLVMVAWVAYDAHVHGEPAVFWGPVAMFGSLFGFALYLTVRGMNSGIGMDGGSRFFSG
jgi:hypothetical protein